MLTSHAIRPTKSLPTNIKSLVNTLIRRNNSTCEEVRIPVPWGHVAGKWWGPKDKRPILTFHGWQDNCGSFDLLIPHLPKHVSYLALDFPGHGFSTRQPVGFFYHNINGAMLIRRLQNYFKWEKISLMGHSLGAITSYTFGGLYPEAVDFVICIDGLSPLINPKRLDRVTQSIDAFLKYDGQVASNKEPPSYTMDQMIQMLYKGTRESIDEDKCKFILERNIKASAIHAGKYYFDRDPRLKSGPLMNWPMEDLLEHARRISFPLIATKSEKSPVSSSHGVYKQVLEILAKNTNVEFHHVKGRHHGHLNTPEIFAEIIPKFIARHDTENRDIAKDIFENIRLQ